MESEQYKELIAQFIESHTQLEEALSVISAYSKSITLFNQKLETVLPEVEKSNALPYNELITILRSAVDLLSQNNVSLNKSISKIDSKLESIQSEFSKFKFTYTQRFDEISSKLDQLLEKSEDLEQEEANTEI